MLRTLGGPFRDPLNTHICTIGPNKNSPLLKAYSLYVTATALRRAAAKQEAGSMLSTSLDLAQRALKAALEICEKIMPRGMEELVVLAVQKELEMAGLGRFRSIQGMWSAHTAPCRLELSSL